MLNQRHLVYSHSQEAQEGCWCWSFDSGLTAKKLNILATGRINYDIQHMVKRGNCLYSWCWRGNQWWWDVGQRGKEGLMWWRREGMEEEPEGKGDVVNFPRIPQSCETASAPSTFVNVRMCACPWLCVQPRLFHSVKHSLSKERRSARLTHSCPVRSDRNVKWGLGWIDTTVRILLCIKCYIKCSPYITLNCTLLYIPRVGLDFVFLVFCNWD